MAQSYNKFQRRMAYGRTRVVSTNTPVLLNAYDPASDATRPALNFPCKDIVADDDVTLWCTGGYLARVSSHTRNVVVVRCVNPTNLAGVTDHAAHAHDLIVGTGVGADTGTFGVGGALKTSNIVGGTVAGGGAVGVQDLPVAMAHAAGATAEGGVELNKNNGAFTVYGTALGIV